MSKTKKYSFSDKKVILQSLNKGLINGHLEYGVIDKFDKIFNNISIDELDFHILLFKLWNKEKSVIKLYNNDKDKLNKILEYINEQINTIGIVNNKKKEAEKMKILCKKKDDNNV